MKEIPHFWLTMLGISIIAIILFCIWLFISLALPCQPTRIKNIDVGNNRSVSIYEECGWLEISALIYYDAREAGNVIVPISAIDYYGLEEIDKFSFEIIYAEEQSLVGIYDSSDPYSDLFIIVDFKTGESWPRPGDRYEVSVARERGFFKRLQNENPDVIKIPTPFPTVSLPTAITAPSEPTPTNTLVIQPTVTPSAP